jgi:hypothetical protein
LSQVARKLERQDGKVDKPLEETLPEYYYSDTVKKHQL